MKESRIYTQKSIDILQFLGQAQKSIKYGHVDLTDYASENLAKILDNLKIVEDLELDMFLKSEFMKNEFRIWEFKNLTKSNEFYLNFPCLLDSEILAINGGKLSNEDVNRFLKFWKMGGALKIRKLRVEVVELDFQRILAGIECKKIAGKKNTYTIRNAKGIPATVYLRIFFFNGTPVFNMIIDFDN
ncbi:hypothetical protein B9Z55_003279 [Caenorhabditis nigoni]|uniref:Sdz-33 F-box domain-containing protein n=1 Tax=Caenorhabditis nigoni TaxID=1611254 RepID=A0A2G5VPS9_9PELO|nr:hypothetical protein B9Z55_003279 [Caenorhabditis nigoni]